MAPYPSPDVCVTCSYPSLCDKFGRSLLGRLVESVVDCNRQSLLRHPPSSISSPVLGSWVFVLPEKHSTQIITAITTPEEATKLENQLRRYHNSFDVNVDEHCPPLVLLKNGKIAKRQQRVREIRVDYWKAQCSFRGLETSGRIEELKDLIRKRDRTKDMVIEQEQDSIQALLAAHYKEKEKEEAERWWQDPSIRLELKVGSDAERALKELLARDPGVRDSALLIRTRTSALTDRAQRFGLSCEIVEPPQSMVDAADGWLNWNSWTVIGRPDLVQQQVRQVSQQANLDAQREKARVDAAKEAKRVEQRNRYAALLDEAKRQDDWNLTGEWSVWCTELATYSQEQPVKLSMQLYRDDFRLDDIRGSDDQSENEYEEDYEEPQRPIAAAEVTAHFQRYCVMFDFGVVEGVMRIFPPEASKSKSAAFKVRNSPRFDYIWRGRETGEGDIQTTADEDVFSITFGDHGSSFEATFKCEYLQAVKITGRKVSHGRGQKRSSNEQWRELSERGHARESRRRWGGW